MIIFTNKLIIKKRTFFSLWMYSNNGTTTEHRIHTFISVMNIFKFSLIYYYVICFCADEDLCQSTYANKCCIMSENYVVYFRLSYWAVQNEATIWISETVRDNVKQFTISIGATLSFHFVCLIETRELQWFSKWSAQKSYLFCFIFW